MKLLITGAEGDIADSLCRIARMTWPACVTHGADANGDSWPCANGFAKIHRLPHASAPEYFAALTDLHASEKFDAIVPATDAELLALSTRLPSDLPLITLEADWLHFALDKMATARWLEARGLPAPRTTELSAAVVEDLPVIIKPRRGHGSKGLEIVETPSRLAVVKAERGDGSIAQRYVGDAECEFTCCVFRHRPSGTMRTVTLRRTLQGGMTGRATVEHVEPIERLLRQIALAGDLDGSVNVQLRLVDSRPIVFEINPRFSSTVMMRHLIGFRDFVWAIESRLEGRPPDTWAAPIGVRMFRLSRELVVFPSKDMSS